MFDTNIFNHLLDSGINLDTLPIAQIYFTFEQSDELQKTKDVDRRKKLLSVFQLCEPTETTIGTFVLDNARLDKTQIGNGVLFGKILERLDSTEKKNNNYIDALIAESSHINGLTFVTDDAVLLETCLEMDISTITLSQFLELAK
ncbi:MAG: hypothetical protein WDA09_10275 [Bacteriovoracaceae bacterium]